MKIHPSNRQQYDNVRDQVFLDQSQLSRHPQRLDRRATLQTQLPSWRRRTLLIRGGPETPLDARLEPGSSCHHGNRGKEKKTPICIKAFHAENTTRLILRQQFKGLVTLSLRAAHSGLKDSRTGGAELHAGLGSSSVLLVALPALMPDQPPSSQYGGPFISVESLAKRIKVRTVSGFQVALHSVALRGWTGVSWNASANQ